MAVNATFKSISAVFQNNGVSSSVTVPAPAGLCVGELMVVMGISTTVSPASINFPAGWTNLDETFPPIIQQPLGFLGTKVATLADIGANFIFSHTGAFVGAWDVGIFRIGGHTGTDTFSVITVDDAPGVNPPLPGITTVADNVLILRFAGWINTGSDPTFTGPAAGHTTRAQVGGPFDPLSPDPSGIWVTRNTIKTPPGFVGAAVVPQDGGGNTRAVDYSLGIVPGVLQECIATPAIAVGVPLVAAQFIAGTILEQVDAIATGVPGVGTTFIPVFVPPPPPPPSPPAPLDDPSSDCIFQGIQVGAPTPTMRDDCGQVPRVDDAVEFTGVQAGQVEPVEPAEGWASLGTVRFRVFSPNSVQ